MGEEIKHEDRPAEETEPNIAAQIDDMLEGLQPGDSREELDEKTEEESSETTREVSEETQEETEVEPSSEDTTTEREATETTETTEELKAPETTTQSTTEDSSDQEKVALQEQVAALLTRVDDLAGQLATVHAKPAAAAVATPAQETPEVVGEAIDFLGNVGLDEVLDSKEALNKVLNVVHNSGIKRGQEASLRSLPAVVSAQVKTQQTINEMVTDFYKENEDLLPVRQTVGIVINELAAANPNWEMNKLLEEVAPKVRTMVGIKKKAVESVSSAEAKPSFPKTSSQRTVTQTKGRTTKLQKEIDDIIDL